jgi:N-acetylglucosamine kinase-like BadF-type ATPase
VRAFYAGQITRAQFASFAAVVVHQAERGNSRAVQYVKQSAGALARLAMHAAERTHLESPAVALVGGMFRSSTMYDATVQWIRDLVPHARCVRPRYDPPSGALLLAYKADGISPQSLGA